MALFKKAAPAAGKKKSDSPIVVAADVVDPSSGKVEYTRDEVRAAISGFASGKEMEKTGQALMETHKPLLGKFARMAFSRLWTSTGIFPKSPKLTTNPEGTGTQVTMSFIDKPSLMNDEQYAELVNLIGAENADDAVERFTQYSIDAKIAGQEVVIKKDKATFQEHIEKALIAYFPEEHHATIGEMLKPKEVFQTKKGLLPRALELIGGRDKPGAALRLADFLVKARIITAYKPGAVGDDD